MRTNKTEDLFSVNTHTPPPMTVDSGEELRGRGTRCLDVEDISAVPTPFTPACHGHPPAPIVGPIVVRGAQPGDVVAIDLIELVPFGSGKCDPAGFQCAAPRVPGADGAFLTRCATAAPGLAAAFRCHSTPTSARSRPCRPRATSHLSLEHTAAISTRRTPARGAGSISQFSSRTRLSSLADPHAAISDGIITGTGIECSTRINLLKDRELERPIIAQGGAVHFVGVGPSVEEATEDAARRAVDFTVARTDLGREEAYMLLSIIGELRVGTSPRPVMATRQIVPEEQLRAAGWNGELP
jgi:acetamidase/formamidase